MNTKELAAFFKLIKADYAYNDDIMCKDSPKVRAIKREISKLDDADNTMIILYAEKASLRKIGEDLGVSHQTIKTEIDRIRKKICSAI